MINVKDYLFKMDILKSSAEYNRLINQRAIKLNGTKLIHDNAEYLISDGNIISVGNQKYVVKLI